MSLKQERSDKFYCESVAKSISEIIRFSLDEDFRKSSFKLFGVSSTKETEKEISKRLMSIIENTSARGKDKTRKRRKKSSEEKDKENLEEQDVKNTNLSSSTVANSNGPNINSQIIPKDFFQKNWIQISSEQYRNAIKRRKLHYFSQPQFSQADETDVESFTSDLYFSNSQPNSLMFDKTVESSLKDSTILDSSADFCQKMFNATFKNNAQKFLKKNSKFHKDFSF